MSPGSATQTRSGASIPRRAPRHIRCPARCDVRPRLRMLVFAARECRVLEHPARNPGVLASRIDQGLRKALREPRHVQILDFNRSCGRLHVVMINPFAMDRDTISLPATSNLRVIPIPCRAFRHVLAIRLNRRVSSSLQNLTFPSIRWRPRTHVGTDETTYRGTR